MYLLDKNYNNIKHLDFVQIKPIDGIKNVDQKSKLDILHKLGRDEGF